MVAVLLLYFAALDYLIHPLLRGDLANLTRGITMSILQVYAFYGYLIDSERQNRVDPLLHQLANEVQELRQELQEVKQRIGLLCRRLLHGLPQFLERFLQFSDRFLFLPKG